MKVTISIILICVLQISIAQQNKFDSFLKSVENAKNDKERVDLLSEGWYIYSDPDSSFSFSERGMQLAQSIGYRVGEMKCQVNLAHSAWALGNFETAIKLSYPVMEYAKSTKDTSLLFLAYGTLAGAYRDQGDYREAIKLSFELLEIVKSTKHEMGIHYALLGSCYYGYEKYDSALVYLNKSLEFGSSVYDGWIALILGKTLEKQNNDSAAFRYYSKSIYALSSGYNLKDLAGAYNSLALLYSKKNHVDSVILYANKALKISQQKNFIKEKSDAYLILSESLKNTDLNESFNYYKLAMEARDSLYDQVKQRQITSFKFNEELRKKEIEAKEQYFKNRNRTFALIGLSFTFLVVMILLYRNNRVKQKAKQEIEQAFEQLKSTQSQLIQSEKMASLGELTAGIAHEIQNPLNFVNNFSEVNSELIDELTDEVDNGNLDEVKAIAKDIKENEQKINHHGKRADAIVKGMLQHSRTSTGQKELTDINALADEYLRLSYHGLRAKDKDFNADFKTEFDENLPKINVIPQDIGRVLLNLINNAFYAVDKRAKETEHPLPPKGGSKNYQTEYSPTVIVSTTSSKSPLGGLGVKISVKDNGSGIPSSIVDKIFQPFFTTKPTGSGTGLGLSLSYDIVKAHGGELKVETKEGEGSEFIIQLKINE